MSKIRQTIIIILYKITFDLVYIYFTSNVFDYMDSKLSFNIEKYSLGWILFLFILILFQTLLKESFNSFCFKIMFLLSGVPGLSLFGLIAIDADKYMLIATYWFFMTIAFSLFQSRTSEKKITSNIIVKDNTTFYNILLIISVFFTLYFWMKYGDFRIITSLFNVYEYRFMFRNANMNPILRYIFVWTGNVFLPYLFAVFLVNKKWGKSFIVLVCGLLFFSIDGMKTRIILYLLVFVTTALFRKTDRYDKVISIITCLLAVSGIMVLFFYNTLSINAIGALYHRTFSVPAELNYKYFEFFTNNPKLYLSESIMRNFIKSPYSILSSFIIGGGASDSIDAVNANTGMAGDAYANFGFFGILFYPFMIAYSFKIFDYFAIKQNKTVVACVAIIVIWYLINASFFTWILTGGFIIYIFIFILSDANKEVENNEEQIN